MTDCLKCKYCRKMGGFFNSYGCFKTNPVSNLNQMYPIMDFLREVGCKSFEEDKKE